jgi:hypothetical protein
LIERQIASVVKTELERLKADPRLIEDLFVEEHGLAREEAQKIRLYFEGGTAADGTDLEADPPIFVHGYPTVQGPFPCWAMTLGGERIHTDYLGRDAAFLDSDGETFYDVRTNKVVDPKARRFQYTFDFLVISRHADITVAYYQLLKRILLSQEAALILDDADELEISGADMAPDPRYLPADVFARVLQLTTYGEENWGAPLTRASGGVGGLHVNDGDGVTVGDSDNSVSAAITPYVGDDDDDEE